LAYLALGPLLLLVPVLVYFGWVRALPELFDSVIRFNAAYVELTLKAGLDSVLEGLRLLAPTGLAVFTLAVWAMASLRLASSVGRSAEPRSLRLATIGLPIEFLMVAVSRRSINHCFIARLPISAVLVAGFFQQVVESDDESEPRLRAGITRRIAWTIGLAVVILLLPLRRLLPPILNFLENGTSNAFVRAADLAENDDPYLLMWGQKAPSTSSPANRPRLAMSTSIRSTAVAT